MSHELPIPDFRIQNFKGFRNLEIPRCARVNLITGRNNVGKTSLLEALGYFNSDFHTDQLIGTLSRRFTHYSFDLNASSGKKELYYKLAGILYPDRNANSDLKLETSLKSLTIKLGSITFNRDSGGAIIGSNFNWTDGGNNPYFDDRVIGVFSNDLAEPYLWLTFEMWKNGNLDGYNYNRKYGTSFIDSSVARSNLIEFFWPTIERMDKENEILKLLHSIDPSIEKLIIDQDYDKMDLHNITKYSEYRVPYLRMAGNKLFDIRNFGQGILNLITIYSITTIFDNAIILIDEIENGVYYELHTEMWQQIFEIANNPNKNIQIFATTHSQDCIRAFAEVAGGNEHKDDGQIIKLIRDEDEISAVLYTEAMMRAALYHQVEMR